MTREDDFNMNIAIIGAGSVGASLARGWHGTGHAIRLGVRDPQGDFSGAELLELDGVRAMSIREAVEQSEVILLAGPGKAATDIAQSLGTLQNQIVIDAMNGPPPAPHASLGAAVAASLQGGRFVKCFNTTGWENMAAPQYGANLSCDMFCAGDDADAKKTVQQLALDLGFGACYDVGGSEACGLLESLAFLWIRLATKQGLGRNFAFKLLRRD